jgi:hypothetical protein
MNGVWDFVSGQRGGEPVGVLHRNVGVFCRVPEKKRWRPVVYQRVE